MTLLPRLREGYHAVVIGASGGIGNAIHKQTTDDPACAACLAVSRISHPGFDLLDEASIEALAMQLERELGTVDLIFDATGVLTFDGQGPEKSIRQIDPAHMAHAFAVNATGPALLLKHLHPLLPRDRPALFATLSAWVGSIGDNRLGGWVSYRASKAALNQILKTAAIELQRTRPQAQLAALQPGTVATGLSAPFVRGRAVLSPSESAERLLTVLGRLPPGESGLFLDHSGNRLPW